MKYFIQLCCLLSSTMLWAQFPNEIWFDNDMQEGYCPYDSSLTGFYPQSFEFFLTKDDTYAGEIDSSWCPTFVRVGTAPRYRYRLDLSDFDFTRPLSIRLLSGNSTPFLFSPYTDHQIIADLWINNLELRQNCGDNCSRQIIKYQAVDEVSGDTIQREHIKFYTSAYPEEEQANCFFSERFQEQQLMEIGTHIWLEKTGEGPYLRTNGFRMHPLYFGASDRVAARQIQFPLNSPFIDSAYQNTPTNIVNQLEGDQSFQGLYYLPQIDPGIPGNESINYMDVNIAGNPDTVTKLQITFASQYDNITFPPFTSLRGGLVEGQDSLRHEITLSFGPRFYGTCIDLSTERPIPQGVTFALDTDELQFANNEACFVIETGGTLSVRPGARTHFGVGRHGMLGSRSAGKVHLENNARLIFSNKLLLLARPHEVENGLHLYLEPGSSLKFAPGARVARKFPVADTWIFVHNNGGQIDFGELTPAERALFRFVEDSPEESNSRSLETGILAYPNPVSRAEKIQLLFPATAAETTFRYELLNPNGSVFINGQIRTPSGMNPEVAISLGQTLVPGVYFLRLTTNDQRYQRKLVITD